MRSTFVLLVVLLAVGVVHGDTFLVTTIADTNDGVCNQHCSLREAVIAANTNPGLDRITLPAGTYVLTIPGAGENQSATGDLDARDDLEIYGAGAATTIIDANGIDRAFHAYSHDVRIVGVTFRGGSADFGGGILNGAYVLWLTYVTVNDNHATLDGGGIYTDYETVLTHSVVSDNTAVRSGGGIYNGSVPRTHLHTCMGTMRDPQAETGLSRLCPHLRAGLPHHENSACDRHVRVPVRPWLDRGCRHRRRDIYRCQEKLT